MFDDEKDREEKDDLQVEPEEVEDLDASEGDEDVKGGMMAETKWTVGFTSVASPVCK